MSTLNQVLAILHVNGPNEWIVPEEDFRKYRYINDRLHAYVGMIGDKEMWEIMSREITIVFRGHYWLLKENPHYESPSKFHYIAKAALNHGVLL